MTYTLTITGSIDQERRPGESYTDVDRQVLRVAQEKAKRIVEDLHRAGHAVSVSVTLPAVDEETTSYTPPSD